MRNFGKAALVAAFIGTMAFILVACSSGGSSASGNAASTEAPSGVFVASKIVRYQEDGSVLGSTAYDLDEHGNTVTGTSVNGDNKSVVKYERDENGYTTKITQPDGQEITYESTFDGDKLMKVVGSNGAISEYQYHTNGIPSKMTTNFGDEFSNVSSYDENGYLTEKNIVFKAGDSANEATIDYTWEFDGSNNPVSLTVTETKAGENISDGLPTGKYTIECDADGNIVKITNAESGKTILEYEYTKVDDPSASCKRGSSITSF